MAPKSPDSAWSPVCLLPESALGEVSGDKVLMSSDNLVRAVKPKIVEILIGY
jgi:hypothetical protein